MRYNIYLSVLLLFLGCTSYEATPSRTEVAEGGGEGSFFPSYQEVKAGQEQALSKELEKTLSGFAGVERVRVHVSMADDRLNSQRQQKSSVAVVIWAKDRKKVNTAKIRGFVAAASVQVDKGSVQVLVNQLAEVERADERPVTFAPYRLVLLVFLVVCLTAAMGIVAIGVRRRMARKDQEGKAK